MADAPVFDYTCSHCGARETYTLVPAQRTSSEPASRPVPEFDFTCSKCGATETYQLVKA
jgi:predicted nucleic-acid-binding Zn-ribbon protein